jgi:hypothetical protein
MIVLRITILPQNLLRNHHLADQTAILITLDVYRLLVMLTALVGQVTAQHMCLGRFE